MSKKRYKPTWDRAVPAFDVEVPDEAWEEAGVTRPYGRLLAHVVVNGLHCHLEAIEVERIDGIQRAADHDLHDAYERLHEGAGADGPWQTTRIGGREYVLVMTPHC